MVVGSALARWLAREVMPLEPELRRWLSTQAPEDLTVDDVVQETYARLIAIDGFEAIANPRAYVFQTARSVVLMHLRRARVVRMEAFTDAREAWVPDTSPPIDESLAWRQQLRLFTHHLEQMPENARAAFKLRFWENMSFAEIAVRLGMTENAAQKNVARNLQVLARRMAEGGFMLPSDSKDETTISRTTGSTNAKPSE